MSVLRGNQLEVELENINREPAPEPEEKVGLLATRLDELSGFVQDNDPALILRLGFHSANTFDENATPSLQGGTEGATMRFPPESTDGPNAGLSVAIRRLGNFIDTHPWASTISIADLWTKASTVAIKVTGGPDIPVESGRLDAPTEQGERQIQVPPNGRITFPSMTFSQLRDNFQRMGLTDREMVVLSGGHTLGEAHRTISGHEGQWTQNKGTFNNEYFRNLINEVWTETNTSPNGNPVPRQFRNADNTLMMLPTDMFLIQDQNLRNIVEEYANDEQLFFQDFSNAFAKLMRKGCPALKGPLLLDEEINPPPPPPPPTPICCPNVSIGQIVNGVMMIVTTSVLITMVSTM